MKPAFPFIAALMAVSACTNATDAPASPPDGDILHYVRSNTDGSMAESVSVYRASDTEVAVFKRVQPCTPAALVTGAFDPQTGSASVLVGGRLSEDGTQVPFLWLTHDAATHTLKTSKDGPGGTPLETVQLPGSAPWRLFDFDFADFNAMARPPVTGETRHYDLALFWTAVEPGQQQIRSLGEMTATWQEVTTAGGEPVARYALAGAGLDGGILDLDPEDGTVVEVRAPAPNHRGYTDYLLRRTGRDQGAEAWASLLAAHWSDCAEMPSD
ncbi:MAG: hypothetical protein KDA53_12930 [Hyphomonas sp.]|nr:hypothetical protein [Hyphomonas sp.]